MVCVPWHSIDHYASLGYFISIPFTLGKQGSETFCILYFLKRQDKINELDQTVTYLKASTLGKIFSIQHFEIFFLFFPRKQVLTFHTNCLQWKQFA